MNVELRPVTGENWIQCIGLLPTEDQERRHFIAPNVFSLAQAYAEPWWRPLAIYANDTLVGFVMHGRRPDSDAEWVLRLMIDARHQGHGHARAAMRVLLDRLRSEGACREVCLSYDEDNHAAARLYGQFGFRPTGARQDGEIVACLPLGGNAGA